MKHLLFFLVLGWFAFTSCQKATLPDATIPAINYGAIPFVKDGNFWVYETYDDFSGEYGSLTVTVIGKKSGSNDIYEVTLVQDSLFGDAETQYWYGMDNGQLMIFSDFENEYQADPVYDVTNSIGDSWKGIDRSTGTRFTYTVYDHNILLYTNYGEFNTTQLEVQKSNSFWPQYNYWNDSLGLVKFGNFVQTFTLDTAYIQ